MRKPPIPDPGKQDPYMFTLLLNVKENLDQLTGRRGGPIEPLPETASLASVIAKINEVIDRLNA